MSWCSARAAAALRRIAAVAITVFGFVSLCASPAIAGQESKCGAQYALEEQLILEWAALGGDPHAQFAIAQCAYPNGASDFTRNEEIYAVKWLTLAACDVRGGPNVDNRDRLTRKLKEKGDLSFRRFGGQSGEEKWTRREKRFQEYREAKSDQLLERYERLVRSLDAETLEDGRLALTDELARLGARGLLRLSELAGCADFSRTEIFAAATADAAADTWARQERGELYGESANPGWTLEAARDQRLVGLDLTQRRSVSLEKAALLRADPARIDQLERDAALAGLENLTLGGVAAVSHEAPLESRVAAPAVTLIAQYALEALGFMEFTEGPDNDYGPATIDAAARAQIHYGRTPTRWLSNADVRLMACEAAVTKADPISFYHLSLMFTRGYGFPADAARARYASERASKIMKTRLSRSKRLDEWKQSAYPQFSDRIAALRMAVDAFWEATPARAKKDYETLSDETLCS